jgi:Polyketide cyclase / dehydrase and lipid transport
MPKPVPLAVTVTRVIDAPAESLYDLVADITRMPSFSPEVVATEWIGGATGPAVGARFKGTNRLGRAKWSTKPTVTAAERGRRFAFKVPHSSGPEWTYLFEAVDGGTRITESMTQTRPSPRIVRFIQRRNGVTDRADHLRQAMVVTLDRLAKAEARLRAAAA